MFPTLVMGSAPLGLRTGVAGAVGEPSSCPSPPTAFWQWPAEVEGPIRASMAWLRPRTLQVSGPTMEGQAAPVATAEAALVARVGGVEDIMATANRTVPAALAS